ncbi:DUF5317 family protein [Patescibacteria group bacterium]|nr:DUF5317 family protein [Patescibacteria group bacterium]
MSCLIILWILRFWLAILSVLFLSSGAFPSIKRIFLFRWSIFLVITGSTLNYLVRIFNDSKMPVDPSIIVFSDKNYKVLTSRSALSFLSDVFNYRGMIAYSLGDLIIGLGAVVVLAALIVAAIDHFYKHS